MTVLWFFTHSCCKTLKIWFRFSVFPGLYFPLLDEIVFPIHSTNFLWALKYESACAPGPGKWKAKTGRPLRACFIRTSDYEWWESGGGPETQNDIESGNLLVRNHLLIKIWDSYACIFYNVIDEFVDHSIKPHLASNGSEQSRDWLGLRW